ncbi:MAG TPA: glycosyltransferase family 2 protein [Propionibacterium sp.]|jgi:glycosyltransferase involved in cell wall biosynthesis|nr:glycosyltransferase family 2 protein [Propionibacterium sp.]
MESTVGAVWGVVPARNEEELIGACLDSLRRAMDRVSVPVAVTVVLDDCTDATAARIPSWVRAVVVRHRSAGAARRAGFRDAPAGSGVWYATTDADSLVPPTWFEGIQASAEAGHDVRAGTVVVADRLDRDADVISRHDAAYRQGADHRHIHGANLALSADSYHAIGGFRALPEHEDVDLIARCLAGGRSVDWSATTPVATSARRDNRVSAGFGGHLTRLEEEFTS